MLSTAARVTRRMTWLALVGGAAWLPVGVVIAAGLLVTTATLSDAIGRVRDHHIAALGAELAEATRNATLQPRLHPVPAQQATLESPPSGR
jgi:hypothetical protein